MFIVHGPVGSHESRRCCFIGQAGPRQHTHTHLCVRLSGVHNWILHTGLLEGVASMSNEAGFIGTVAYMRNVVRWD
jgi:hypothetical protein